MRRGNRTRFIYGGEVQCDNMRCFCMGNGFQGVAAEKDYQNPVFTGSEGVPDEDLLNCAREELSGMQGKLFLV